MTRNDTLTAEMWWALKANSSHYSYKPCEDRNFLVQQMFPDSDIAKKFTCGEKKASHLTCFVIAPHWAIALNFRTPGVEEQWNSSGVSYKSCGILQGFSQKSWNSLGVKH